MQKIKNYVSVEAVHTHTHTHRQFRKNKKIYREKTTKLIEI